MANKGLAEYVEITVNKMTDCAVCLSLFTDNYKESADSLLQFAVALMLEKPILLLVRKGTHIPEKVRQIADRIEYWDVPDDLPDASRRLIEGYGITDFEAVN